MQRGFGKGFERPATIGSSEGALPDQEEFLGWRVRKFAKVKRKIVKISKADTGGRHELKNASTRIHTPPRGGRAKNFEATGRAFCMCYKTVDLGTEKGGRRKKKVDKKRGS